MTNYDDSRGRDIRVILAGVVLALQIIGLLWLLLFGRGQLAAMTGQDQATESVAQTVAAEATSSPAATDAPVATTANNTPAAAEATAPPTAVPDGTTIGPEEVLIESSAVAPEWLATLVEGSPGDAAAGRPPLPPHLLLTFVGPEEEIAAATPPDEIDLNRPQVRIIPIAALLALLEQNGDEAGQKALQELLMLLDERPDADEAIVPVPPVLGAAVQNFVSRAAYTPFGGGSGVGYLTNITGQDVLPVTNESGLNYVYQGLTSDGRQYVFMSWPVEAAFLPNDQAGAVYETEMLATDRVNYYEAVTEQVNTAAEPDLTPSLLALHEMIRSLSIGGLTAAVENEPLPATAFDAVGFNWHWTTATNAAGEASPVENSQDFSLVLWPDGTYSIRADCNVGGGVYTYEADGGIRLAPGPLSRAQCPKESRDAEFVRSLLNARTIAFDESGDMLLGLEDGGTLTFANLGPVDGGDAAESDDQPAAADAGLTGVTLQWPGYTDATGAVVTADNPADYILTLLPDGTFNVIADCNVGGGIYTYNDDGTLQFGPIRLTKMGCPDGSRSSDFVAFLESVSGAAIQPDGGVTLTTSDGRSATLTNQGDLGTSDLGTSAESAGEAVAQPTPTLVATAEAAPATTPLLAETVWQWTHFRDMKQDFDVTGTYTIAFHNDGTVAVVADCNSGSGTYQIMGDAGLNISIQALTGAACPPGSLGQSFVESLNFAGLFFVNGGVLTIELMADGGTMTFAPLQ
ncbi:MAG: META domain-containing protein [Candidatus Promineofilum sp.]|nr:META domain-containing protein [Promineifilum sp.]